MSQSYIAGLWRSGRPICEVVTVTPTTEGRPPERLTISNTYGHLPDGIWNLIRFDVQQHTAHYTINEGEPEPPVLVVAPATRAIARPAPSLADSLEH